MKHAMQVGDIWSYDYRGEPQYFLCMGHKTQNKRLFWILYEIRDVHMENSYPYEDEVFQSVVSCGVMKLVSRVA